MHNDFRSEAKVKFYPSPTAEWLKSNNNSKGQITLSDMNIYCLILIKDQGFCDIVQLMALLTADIGRISILFTSGTKIR